MTFDEVTSELRTFWDVEPWPFTGGGAADLERLHKEFGRSAFPSNVEFYIGQFLGPSTVTLERYGNPLDLYGFEGLTSDASGYSHNAVTGETLDDWDDDWLLIGDIGGDPVIVDLSKGNDEVLTAIHGAGVWEFTLLAESIPQFILLSAAVDHALRMVPYYAMATDDERGVNLNSTSAEWLFPRMKAWAPAMYDTWLENFDNR